MDIKDYLRSVRKLNKDIDAMKRTKEELRYGLLGSGIPIKQTHVQESAPTDKMAKTMAAVVDLEEQIQRSITRLVREQSKALGIIQTIKAPEHRAIMVDYYINAYTWAKVADLNGYSIQHTYEIHGMALKEIREKQSKSEY
jgi:hypothetical protein